MPGLLDHVDPDGLLEYSVVYTDRSLNHMSQTFQKVMKGISSSMKAIYNADSVAVVPGGGSYAMEAIARQFARGKNCLILRNGLFSAWHRYFDFRTPKRLEQLSLRRTGYDEPHRQRANGKHCQ